MRRHPVVTSGEVAPEMIARAKDLSQGLANAEFHLATFPQHDLPLGRFDVIFSMEVLYYLPSLSAALEEVVRLLKPYGRRPELYGAWLATNG